MATTKGAVLNDSFSAKFTRFVVILAVYNRSTKFVEDGVVQHKNIGLLFCCL